MEFVVPMPTSPVLAPPPPKPKAPRRALRGFTIARIFGIEIRLDASWIVIVTLVTVSLALNFGREHPGLGAGYHWLAAAFGSLAFFASLLLHELSHSLVARARGIQVEGITLFLFGGVSELKGEAARPRDEFVIAAVGPVTSAALGVLCAGLAAAVAAGTILQSVLRWLAFINVALAIFNLLPGFPLDGGRIFRAVAWGITRNLRRATRIAAKLGKAIAFLLIFSGIVLALGFGWVLNGLWLAFIGWFLMTAAQSSVAQVEMRAMLERFTVRDAMRADCDTVDVRESVRDFVEHRVLRTGSRCFLVLDGAEFRGLVTLHEVKGIPRERWAETPVEQVMIPYYTARSISPSASLLEAIDAMDEHGFGQLPVTEEGRLLGLVTREDALRLVALNLELGG